MEAAMERMEAQLRNWHLKIDRLAAAIQVAGVPVDFEALVYIDELKALHAIARSKLDQFKAAESTERGHLETGMRSAWSDLEEALENLVP